MERRFVETAREAGEERRNDEEDSPSPSENLVQHARVRKYALTRPFFRGLSPCWRSLCGGCTRSPVSSVSGVPISQLVEMRS